MMVIRKLAILINIIWMIGKTIPVSFSEFESICQNSDFPPEWHLNKPEQLLTQICGRHQGGECVADHNKNDKLQ